MTAYSADKPEQAKFRRDKDEWYYPAVDQALNLDTLLDNLRTFSIKEQAASGDKGAVLLPLSKGEFKYLLSLLYDHQRLNSLPMPYGTS